jgi:hypothetical protein
MFAGIRAEGMMERRYQRLKAYTYAQWRLRQEMAAGRTGSRALIGVVGEARARFRLTSEEWRVLVRALATTVSADVDE